MAELKPVDEVPGIEREGSARKSEPIVNEFMESGTKAAAVEDEDSKAQSTKQTLARYVKSRNLPIEVVTRKGTVYMRRTDLDTQAESEPETAAV